MKMSHPQKVALLIACAQAALGLVLGIAGGGIVGWFFMQVPGSLAFVSRSRLVEWIGIVPGGDIALFLFGPLVINGLLYAGAVTLAQPLVHRVRSRRKELIVRFADVDRPDEPKN